MSWIADHVLTLTIFAPLVGAIVVVAMPSSRPDLVRYAAFATTLVTLALSLAALARLDLAAGGFQLVDRAEWIPAFGITYKVGADGIAMVLVVLTTLLTAVSVLASFGPIQERVKAYMVSFLVLEVGMVGVFLALDLFLFYIFWELVLIPMYLIIGIWGGPNRIYATIKFVIYTLVGSLLMLVAILGVAYVYQAAQGSWTGAFDFERLRDFAGGGGFGSTLQTLAFWAFFLAFAIKVPMVPFHTWLPDAHVEAPTAGSVILAGVLLKLGGFGFIRYSLPLFPDASQQWAPVMVVLSLVAIVYGAIVALGQTDLKKLVAYSSVSHMGFVTLGIFVFQPQALQGAILQMVNHGLITGALFLCVGVIYERTHDREIANMGGLAERTPVYASLLGFFTLASLGLPGLAGFVGEFLVIVGTFAVNPAAAAIAALVMILSAVYLLFMFQRVAFGEPSESLRRLGDRLTDVAPIELATLAPLAILTVLFGVLPGLVLVFLPGGGPGIGIAGLP